LPCKELRKLKGDITVRKAQGGILLVSENA